MKKTDTYVNIITGVLFVAVALYLFGWLWRSTHANIVTAPVDAVSITDSAQADGIAVRAETLLSSDRQYISVQAEDGKSAAKGEVLAISMNSEEGLSRMNHIAELKIEIQSLQTLLSGHPPLNPMSPPGTRISALQCCPCRVLWPGTTSRQRPPPPWTSPRLCFSKIPPP